MPSNTLAIARTSRLMMSVGIAGLVLDAHANNVLTNGDFATDYNGWTITDTSSGQNVAYWTPPAATPPWQGGTTGGSLNLTAFPATSIAASQCAALATKSINASVLIYPLDEEDPATAQVVAFESSNCDGPSLAQVLLQPTEPITALQWNVYQSIGASLPDGTKSVRFELAASGGAGTEGDYLFDNAKLDTATIFDDGFEIGPGITGNWYNPSQSGHGFAIEILPGNLMLAEWYVYAPSGGQSWIVATGTFSGNTALLQAVQTQGAGGRFPPNFNAADVGNNAWGTITFTFNDCNNGTVAWQPVAPGYASGSMMISRLTLPQGLSCA